MIFVRTNPKVALLIVAISLLTSVFIVWKVTSATDKAVSQAIELQRETAQSFETRSTTDVAAAKTQAKKAADSALETAKSQPGVTDEMKAQIDAAAAQFEAATQE